MAFLGKAFGLELHMLNTEKSHDVGPIHSQEAIRSESSEDHSRSHADTGGLSYLPTSVWGCPTLYTRSLQKH